MGEKLWQRQVREWAAVMRPALNRMRRLERQVLEDLEVVRRIQEEATAAIDVAHDRLSEVRYIIDGLDQAVAALDALFPGVLPPEATKEAAGGGE